MWGKVRKVSLAYVAAGTSENTIFAFRFGHFCSDAHLESVFRRGFKSLPLRQEMPIHIGE